jgi:hypothetical protein
MSYSQNAGPPSAGPNGARLVARAKAILMTPDTEWAAIDAEPASPAGLYRNYIMILAAIPPLAAFLHAVLFGYGAFGITYRPSFGGALSTALVHYALTLAGVYVLALIVDGLAPGFQGRKNFVQALKLVAYASTASWLAGVFALIPGLGILGILGLFSLYLFYLGLPVMMKCPPGKSLPYTLVILVCAIVVGVVIAPLSALLVHGSMGGGTYADGSGNGGTLTLPTGKSVQMDRLQQAAAALGAAVQPAAPGGTSPRIATDTLKAMLPAQAPGGLARTGITSAGGQVAGFGASTAEAKYSGGGGDMTLSVTDLGPLGALASMSGVLGVNGDEETATSSSKLYQKDGNTIAESYDRDSHSGSYGVVIASRFLVKAEGTGLSLATLKDAVAGVDLTHLASLAR